MHQNLGCATIYHVIYIHAWCTNIYIFERSIQQFSFWINVKTTFERSETKAQKGEKWNNSTKDNNMIGMGVNFVSRGPISKCATSSIVLVVLLDISSWGNRSLDWNMVECWEPLGQRGKTIFDFSNLFFRSAIYFFRSIKADSGFNGSFLKFEVEMLCFPYGNGHRCIYTLPMAPLSDFPSQLPGMPTWFRGVLSIFPVGLTIHGDSLLPHWSLTSKFSKAQPLSICSNAAIEIFVSCFWEIESYDYGCPAYTTINIIIVCWLWFSSYE